MILSDSERIELLKPLLEALPARDNPRRFDIEFLKCLSDAAEFLDTRMRTCKGANIGSGELTVKKWLLEHQHGVPKEGEHTVKELNREHISKFADISDHKLREYCRETDYPLKRG